ncbi:MAG TPA: hypothetical protein ENI43_04930, partial [Firmicutes bacterium]|nr:hypothetical protein [Bacillota bacterium]
MNRFIQIVVAIVIVIFVVTLLSCKTKETRSVTTPENIEAVEKKIRESYQEKVNKVREEVAKIQKSKNAKVEPLIKKAEKQRNLAIDGYEEFLAKYPGSAYTPDILIRLGEVYFERSEAEHIKAIEEFEKALEEADPTMPSFMEEPKSHYEETIRAYQQIVVNYPNFEYIDTAYYGLGYCLGAQQEYQEAAET